KAPGDWRTPKASPPRLRFGVRQSSAALAWATLADKRKRQGTGALQKLRLTLAFWSAAVLCRFGLGNANGQGKAPGDWRTPKASPPRLRFGVRQSSAALATILIWPLSRLLPQPLQFSLQLFKNPLGTGRFDEILHLV